MNKRKALADLYSTNPWLQDLVSSLEAQIATLADKNTAMLIDFDDLLEDNEELEQKVANQSQELRAAHSDHASLYSRYQTLITASKELVRRNEELYHDQEKETTNLAVEAEELQGED